MRIDQAELVFRPINITLESKHEAETILSALYYAESQPCTVADKDRRKVLAKELNFILESMDE